MQSGNNKVLVTGGAGFIGAHLVNRLLEDGYEVVVIDNESSSSDIDYRWNSNAENHKLDICDYELTRPIYNKVKFVFHLAAQARIQKGIDSPLENFKVNSYGTSVVLQCAKEAGAELVVFSSTSSSYGNNATPNVETQEADCLNPYSVAKINAENICKIYSQSYGIDTIVFRYFNVYGPGQSKTGQYATVIGIFEEKIKMGHNLTITGDGTQRRDFTHVNDAVEANMLALSHIPQSGFKGEVFNIGSGKNYSINEVADLFGGDVEYIEKRPGESMDTLANNDKAKSVLGWIPKVSLTDYVHSLDL